MKKNISKVNYYNKTPKKRSLGFTIFYIAAFTVLGIISFFGNSFFAYEFFNSLFFDILYLVLTVAVFIVLSIQNLLKQTTTFGKWFSIVYFNLFALVFALKPFVNRRIWAIALFCGFIIGFVLLLILAFKRKKASWEYPFNRFCPMIVMIPALMLLMLAAMQSYVGSQGMWIPIVAGGVILSAISLLVFIRFFIKSEYFATQRGERIAAIFLIAAAAFMFSGMTVTSVNYAFDSAPAIIQVEIVDKSISSGARQATTFNLKVLIEGNEETIEVPVDVYHSKEIADSIEIKLYKGALGYSYYMYERQ